MHGRSDEGDTYPFSLPEPPIARCTSDGYVPELPGTPHPELQHKWDYGVSMIAQIQLLAARIAQVIEESGMDQPEACAALQLVLTAVVGDTELINFCGHCQTGYRTREEASACARRCGDTATRRSSGG